MKNLKTSYDAIIIGGGHNGLVAAGYLALQGKNVAVFEARHTVGGCAVTEEPFSGFKFSSLSYVNSLFRPEIIRDLKLHSHGFEMLPRSPSSYTPFLDGRSLLMGPDKELTHKEISKFNRKDADNHPKYEEMLEKLAEILEPIMTMEPLDPNKSKLADIFSYLKFGWSKRRQLKKDWPELMRFFSGSASDMLNRWFESEELKTTLATDAVIGANASPSTPGTSYVLFHHVMGECNGVKGVWGYMRGGMGGLSQSIARSCASLGVDIFTNAFVEKIIIKNNIAIGVVVNGNEVYAKQIASNATPKVTFEKLIQPAELPDDFLKNIRHINYDSASIKINLALSELPNFSATPGLTVGPQHMGTIHICPDMQYIENAYAESVSGKPSSAPILECSIPTSVDNTLAPSGKHVMNIFSQYAPFNLKTGTSWDQEKEAFADRAINVLAQYAPNIKSAILYRQVISPLDMEREYHLTGGSLHHGRLNLDQMFNMRPVPGYSDYTCPIKNLFLCGAGSHPGGGVMGTPGWNAARKMLRS